MITRLLSRTPLRLIARMAFMLALGVSLPHKPAQAWFTPPCEKTECPAGAAKWWAVHASLVTAQLAALEFAIYTLVQQTADALTRLGNQTAVSTQSELTARAAMTDLENANTSATAMADQVKKTTAEVEPSIAVCNIVSKRNLVTKASFNARLQVSARELEATNLMTNAIGTAGEKGATAYLSERFRIRMQRYCHAGQMQVPAGVTCAASIGENRDIFPYESIWSKHNLTTANDYTAAKDVIYNLMGGMVTDPIRGAALSRDEGRTLSLIKGTEVAKINIAFSPLMAMVERRRDATGQGKSEISLIRQASFIDGSLEALAVANAAQLEPQNLKTVTALVGEGTRNLFALRGFMEQWAAIRAVSLAMDVKKQSVGVSAAGQALEAISATP